MQKWMLLMPLALMACGDKTEDTAGEEGETVTVEPQEGGWTMTSIEFTTDTCGMDDDGDTGSETDDTAALNLTKNDDGSYTLLLDEDLSFACSLSGSDFSCDPLVMTESDEDMDMTFSQTFNLGGVFASSTELNGDVGMDMACEGADCAMLAEVGMTMPCTMAGVFTAVAN